MTKICGVDDAGRGPVIGPMIIAGVLFEESELPKLKEIGVKDSKLLTPKQREKLYKQIIELADDYSIEIVSPQEIDEALNSVGSNLNKLETINMAKVINAVKAEKAIIDCPSNNITAFNNYLRVSILAIISNIIYEKPRIYKE